MPISVPPRLPSLLSPPAPAIAAADTPNRLWPSATVALPPPRKLLLLRQSPGGLLLSHHSLFGIAVVDATAAVAISDDADDVTACPVGRIPPPRFKSRCRPPPPSTNHCHHQAVFAAAAANLVVITPLSAAAILPCNHRHCRRFLSAVDTVISRYFVDCCIIAICLQCFLTS